MLVNEILAEMKEATKDIDVSSPLSYIKEKMLDRKVRFYPIWQEGSIMAEPNQFMSQEQAVRLSFEGFTVEQAYSKNAMGHGTHFSGYTVSW